MIIFGFQFILVEKERDKVKVDNKDFVDCWMKCMVQEVDVMNLVNEFYNYDWQSKIFV